MKRLLILVIFLLLAATVKSIASTRYLIPCKSSLISSSRDSAIAQVGVKELTGKNDGYKVEQYLKSVGRYKGEAYCAAGQYWSFFVSCLALRLPITEIPICRTGSTVMMFNDAMQNGTKTKAIPYDNDFMFWRNPRQWSGHVERIIEVMRAGWVKTVGFNTSPGLKGSQSNGGGVFIRLRNVNQFLGRMLVRGFIGFKPI